VGVISAFLMAVHVFPDHDGVIDEQPENQDERE